MPFLVEIEISCEDNWKYFSNIGQADHGALTWTQT